MIAGVSRVDTAEGRTPSQMTAARGGRFCRAATGCGACQLVSMVAVGCRYIRLEKLNLCCIYRLSVSGTVTHY